MKFMFFKAEAIQGKILTIYEMLESQQPDILIITDTQYSQNQDIQFFGYQFFKTMSSKMSGVIILVKYQLKAHLVEMYNDSQLTVEISIDNQKLFVLAANMFIEAEWKSFKNLVKNLKDIYLNPKVVICGNFNKFYYQLQRIKQKYNFNWADQLTVNQEIIPQFRDEINALVTSEDIVEMKRQKYDGIASEVYQCLIALNTYKKQVFIGDREFYSKKRVSQFLRRMYNFSLTKDPSYIIKKSVYKTVASTHVFRPQQMFNMPYEKDWFQKRSQFKENIWSIKLQKIDKALRFKNIDINKFYNKIQKAIKHGNFCENAHGTLDGRGVEVYAKHYGQIYSDPSLEISKIMDSKNLPDQILKEFLERGIQNLKIGQGLSRDLIPDDCFSKQLLIDKVFYERDSIFNSAERLSVAEKAKALIISKNNK
ncbi:UNKNOWN [Stylonychia lemnae]|uniref:Uncharacterized protein n=1 Tax=Stylonychia lemnae TaxID=5949 RepID=A0A078AZ63_STYLE|nr:UNKNOWN [Stylonychia lemnae]|eukprot:CDW86497.1 UNKNOWN [Stylonychia lemnae]